MSGHVTLATVRKLISKAFKARKLSHEQYGEIHNVNMQSFRNNHLYKDTFTVLEMITLLNNLNYRIELIDNSDETKRIIVSMFDKDE